MKIPSLARQGALFAVVGACATLTHVCVALAARELLSQPPMHANLFGYLAAVGVSYLGNARFTFRRKAMHGPQLLRFLVISGLGLIGTQSITWLLVEKAHWPFPAGLAVVVVAVPTFSFFASRAWAFRAPTPIDY